jgi:hypothetical protein
VKAIDKCVLKGQDHNFDAINNIRTLKGIYSHKVSNVIYGVQAV